MRRWVRLTLCGLAVGLCVAGAWWLLRPRVSIQHSTFQRIQVGMSEDEVASLLGGPAGFYGDAETVEGEFEEVVQKGFVHKRWRTPTHVIHITFDDAGRVHGKREYPPTYRGDGLLDVLFRWLSF